MPPKRHLPVVSAPPEDGEPARPGWQWVGFGTVAIFVAWLPLSAAAGAIATRFQRPGDGAPDTSVRAAVAFAIASALALGAAAVTGGFIVGRWAGRSAGWRESALAGLATAGVAIGASWVSFGFAPGALLVAPIAVLFAGLGGWLGTAK
jgi:hypothetical protein